jgi:hypothetical protein
MRSLLCRALIEMAACLRFLQEPLCAGAAATPQLT